MGLVFSTFLFLLNAFAQTGMPTCDPLLQEPLNLHLVSPSQSQLKNPVTVQWALENKNLMVHFDVQTAVQSEQKVFAKGDYPFQFDVAEIFLAVQDGTDKNMTYFEFEVTPNNQAFNVKIDIKEGKKKFTDNVDVGSLTSVQRDKSSWTASLQIPLERIGWNGDLKLLRGNFYVIIGKKPQKTYWSAFLPKLSKGEKLDFHRPQFFKPLFICK